MGGRPVFLYAAIYGNRQDAFADYDTLLELHAEKLVGTYDVALVAKDPDGKVHVEKHEKPTQHGAWGGVAVGARDRRSCSRRRSSGRRPSAESSAGSAATCARASRAATPRSWVSCSKAARPR